MSQSQPVPISGGRVTAEGTATAIATPPDGSTRPAEAIALGCSPQEAPVTPPASPPTPAAASAGEGPSQAPAASGPSLSTEVQQVIDVVMAATRLAQTSTDSRGAVAAGLAVVSWLRDSGLALLSQEYDRGTGNNVFHVLARAGNVDVLRHFRTILGDFPANNRNREGATPLALAFAKGHVEAARELLHGWGADDTVADHSGWACIHIAALVGNPELVNLLCGKSPACVGLQTMTKATPLFLAAQKGHLETCKALVAAGASLVCERRDGSSALFIACQEGHLDVASFLLQEAGAEVNEATRSGSTPLHAAAVQNHLPIVKMLLSRRSIMVDALKSDAWSALHAAAYKGYADIARALVVAGSSCVAQDGNGWTPLHLAAHQGHTVTVRVLVAANPASTARQTRSGATPLLLACQQGHLAAVRVIVDGGPVEVDDPCQYQNQCSPLFVACQEGHLGVARWLAEECGSDVNAPTAKGATPLYASCVCGHLPVVRWLVEEMNADANRPAMYGWTPLHDACAEGRAKVVEFLLGLPETDVNCEKADKASPLFVAAWRGHEDVVRLLLAADAEVDRPDVDGTTPLFIAAQQGHDAVVDLLVTRGRAKVNCHKHGGSHWLPVHAAAGEGFARVLSHLIAGGADATIANTDGLTAMHLACWRGHVNVVKILAAIPACLTSQTSDGSQPLLLAAHQGRLGAVRVLLDHGAPLEATKNDGAAALHSACREGHLDVVVHLVEAGADPNQADFQGWTCLHAACWKGHADIVTFLCMHGGANVNQMQMNGATPSYMSAVRGHVDIVKMLTMCGANLGLQTEHGLTTLDAARPMGMRLTVWIDLVRTWDPLQVAVYEGREDMITWLLRTGRADPLSRPAGTPQLGLLAQLTRPSVQQLVEAARRPWRPSANGYFGPSFRRLVFDVLLVAGRLASMSERAFAEQDAACHVFALPPELWLAILSFVGRNARPVGEGAADGTPALVGAD